MRKFTALVLKDFRELKWYLIVLCLTIVVSAIISTIELQYHILCQNFPMSGSSHSILLFDYSHSAGLVMAVLLVYSFAELYSSKTYTFFSLPMRRSAVFFSKVFVISVSAFLIAFFAILAESLIQRVLWWTPVGERLLAPREPDPMLRRMLHDSLMISGGWIQSVWLDYVYWARHILLFPGMVCFAQGVTALIKRYRFAVWTITLFISLFLYTIISNGVIEKEFITVPMNKRPLWVYLFDLEAGLVFMIAGCAIFERCAEV